MEEIAAEAELDLTGIHIGKDYELTPIPPEPDEVRTLAFRKVLLRWHAGKDDPAHRQALIQLLPNALTHLSCIPVVDDEVLDGCMAILRIEQALTPHVAQYLQQIPDDEQPQALAALDRLLAANPYLTPWQASWLSPALSRATILTKGTQGAQRVGWLRSVWDDVRAPEPVRAGMAEALARHKIVSKAELLELYDRMSETSRPALALALGVAGLNPSGKQARALTSEDDLIRWQFEWGVTNK